MLSWTRGRGLVRRPDPQGMPCHSKVLFLQLSPQIGKLLLDKVRKGAFGGWSGTCYCTTIGLQSFLNQHPRV